jgi:hypothetical protein
MQLPPNKPLAIHISVGINPLNGHSGTARLQLNDVANIELCHSCLVGYELLENASAAIWVSHACLARDEAEKKHHSAATGDRAPLCRMERQ